MTRTKDAVKKRTRVKFLTNGHISKNWDALEDAECVVALGPSNGLGVVTFYYDDLTLAFGIPREDHDVYLAGDSSASTCFHGWLWGQATEVYDHCLEYFGAGPLVFMCWSPSDPVPRPLKAFGRLCRIACDAVDASLERAEAAFPRVRQPRTLEWRINAWLSVYAVNWLHGQARELDPAPCYHPGCSPTERCKFSEPDK